MEESHSGSIMVGSMWMIFLSALLFWLPVFGPLIAGWVGGVKSGGPMNGIIAVFFPAVVVAVLLALVPAAALTGIPVIGVIVGVVAAFGLFIFIGLQVGLLLVGAIIGGVMS